MHIAEGVLSAPILITGALVAVAGIAVGLKRLPNDRLMTAGLVGAAFFVASLIHVPIGPTSVHLILNGLVGILLGWAAIPVIFVALLLQSLLFQFGGLTVLGVNTVTMGSGALVAAFLFHAIAGKPCAPSRLTLAASVAGFMAVAVSAVLTAAALAFTDEGFIAAAGALLLAHLPVMLVEGVMTALICRYITKIYPDMFSTTLRPTKES